MTAFSNATLHYIIEVNEGRVSVLFGKHNRGAVNSLR
jgi:hypothetical protein